MSPKLHGSAGSGLRQNSGSDAQGVELSPINSEKPHLASQKPALGFNRPNEQQGTAILDPTISSMAIEMVVPPEQPATIMLSSAVPDPVVNIPLQAQDTFHEKGAASKIMFYDRTLNTAVSSGNVERTRELLAKAFDVNCKDSDGNTPLITAAQHRHELVIKLLLENGANQGITNKAGDTGLHFLSRNNGVPLTKSCIDLFFQDRPPFDAKNNANRTPLMVACSYGEEELAVRLIHHGADICAFDSGGDTPLNWAATNQNGPELVILLIKEGALIDWKAEKPNKRTPLHGVAQYCKSPIAVAMVELLLNAGVDKRRPRSFLRYPFKCRREIRK